MNRLVPAILVATFVAFIFFVMLRAWHKRVKASDSAELNAVIPAGSELVTSIANVFYVATVHSLAPLERVALRGLRFRGWSTIDVYNEGVIVRVRGEQPVTLPTAVITGTSARQMVIDKVVESGGLIGIDWVRDDQQLSTVFRVNNAEQRAQFQSLEQRLTKHAHSPINPQHPTTTLESSPIV